MLGRKRVTIDSGNQLLGNHTAYKAGMAGWLAVCAAMEIRHLLLSHRGKVVSAA
jgi:hypothetical protein